MGTRLRSSTRASTAASESLAETMAEMKPKGDSRKSTSSRPIKASEMAKLKRIAGVAFVASFIMMGGLFYVVMNDTVKLYPATLRSESFKGYSTRVEYAIRYQALLYFWLLINIFSVIFVRMRKSALNPLVESTEKHTQAIKNILSNSFEQILLSSFSQLAFVSFADAPLVLRLIPAINFTQFIGRVAFLFGYPLYRTLGFSLTMSPNILMAVFNVYKLGSYLEFY